jgi:TolB-like protein/Tfp pilus assembly protein PilF
MKVFKNVQRNSKRNPKTSASSMTSDTANHVYYFGSFCLNQAEQRLLRNGEPIRLAPKVFDVLLVLIQNQGCLVTKDRLLQEVWPDAFVEEANLSVNIACLRKALNEGVADRQYIETVPKRGYRFVAPVSESRNESSGTVNTPLPKESFLSDGEHRGDVDQTINSLAVLPFVNESCDPEAEYLSTGLTESIINNLSQLRGLRVMARNTVYHYQGKDINSRVVGQELGVRSVLTGRILQLGDRLIIRTELVDVVTGWQLWGEQYQIKLSDILVLQEEIAEEMSERLRIKLTINEKRQLSKRHTDNAQACNLYMKGRYHWNKYAQKGLGQAVEYFSQAINLDPTYALAYAGMADSYYRLSDTYSPAAEVMPKAKLAAEKALEIDETLAEAHTALGLVLMFYDWEWKGAEREFSRAIELNPGYAIAHQRLALYFSLLGRLDEAMSETQVAVELDPLSLHTSQSVAFQFFLKGEYEQAIEQQEKTLEREASYHPAYYMLGWVYERKGDFSKAIESFLKATDLDDCPLFLGALGHAYGLNGNRIRALSILDELEEQSKRRYVSSYSRAVVYVGLDERDLAFQWLEKAVGERSAMLTCLKIGCEFDGLRGDPRFPDLLRRVGFTS